MDKLQKKCEGLLSNNVELKNKEMSFQSYAKACDTLTEVHSYLRDASEKGGLRLDTQTNSSTTLNKNDERMIHLLRVNKVVPKQPIALVRKLRLLTKEWKLRPSL